MNKELQHTDDFIFFVALFAFFRAWPFLTQNRNMNLYRCLQYLSKIRGEWFLLWTDKNDVLVKSGLAMMYYYCFPTHYATTYYYCWWSTMKQWVTAVGGTVMGSLCMCIYICWSGEMTIKNSTVGQWTLWYFFLQLLG